MGLSNPKLCLKINLINKNMNENKQKDALKWIIIGLASFVIVILIFNAGMFVGGMKARFSYKWAESYHENFAGPRGGFLGDWRKSLPFPGDFIEGHGTFGEIIKINDTEFVVRGQDNVEKLIIIKEDTIIEKGRTIIKKEELEVGNQIVVIGSPNEQGQIEAKLIRVFDNLTNGLPLRPSRPFSFF